MGYSDSDIAPSPYLRPLPCSFPTDPLIVPAAMGALSEYPNPALLTPPLSDSEFTLFDDVKLASEEVCQHDGDIIFERKLGDTELSYYLPSRQSGVNDMCGLKSRSICARRLTVMQVPSSRLSRTSSAREALTRTDRMGHPPSSASAALRERPYARL